MTDDVRQKRTHLIQQADHLLDELDALESQVGFVPDELLSASPLESEPSIKEMYALVGLYDRRVYLPAILMIKAGDNEVIEELDDSALLADRAWNEEVFSEIMSFVRGGRVELTSALKDLSPSEWDRRAIFGERNLSAYDVVYGLVQHDAALLRAVALRLHSSARRV